jgi:beta-glucosidase/6-phospho-beta-glucosidase/beta-galactosidase
MKLEHQEEVPVADSGPDHWNRYKEDFDIAQSLRTQLRLEYL